MSLDKFRGWPYGQMSSEQKVKAEDFFSDRGINPSTFEGGQKDGWENFCGGVGIKDIFELAGFLEVFGDSEISGTLQAIKLLSELG